MRVARVLVPFAVAGVLLAGCGDRTAGNGTWSAPSNGAGSAAPAGNGVADLTAKEILAKANAALKKAGSFRVKGETKDEDETMAIDLKIRGNELIGTLTMGKTSFQLLLVDEQPYFKADGDFWKNTGPRGEGMARLVGDRWVKVAADDQNFAGLFKMAESVRTLETDGKVTKGKVSTVDAGPAIALVDESDQSTLYVATTDEPYPLLMVGPEDQGEIAYSAFGESFPEIATPDETDTIDFSEL